MEVRHVAAIAACLITLAGSGSASASSPCRGDLDATGASNADAAARAVVCNVNQLRARHGLRALRWNWRLWASAQRMAVEINERRFFAHVTPDGRDLVDRVYAVGYLPKSPTALFGENLAWGRGALASPRATVLGWLHSPSHRRNLLERGFADIGVGISPSSNGGVVFVANFGRR